MSKMTSHSPDMKKSFQQVCECSPTHNSIDFPNCTLNCFLEVCNTSRSIFIDNILEITPQKKVRRAQIWATWWPFANSLPKKFCQRRYCPSPHRYSCSILKHCLVLILMQKCNKLMNNIMVYLYSNCLKKIGLTTRLRIMPHQTLIS